MEEPQEVVNNGETCEDAAPEMMEITPALDDLMFGVLGAPLISDTLAENPYADEMIKDGMTFSDIECFTKSFRSIQNVKYQRVHCTCCNKHIGTAVDNDERQKHPLLQVIICEECYLFYSSGDFDKDKDGSELYCRWCGEGGQVFCCSKCPYVFCKKCISRNLGRGTASMIETSDDWLCFNCNTCQINKQRALCWALHKYAAESKTAAEEDSEIKKTIFTDFSMCCKSKRSLNKTHNATPAKKPKLDQSVASPLMQDSNPEAQETPANFNWQPQDEAQEELICAPDIMPFDDSPPSSPKEEEKVQEEEKQEINQILPAVKLMPASEAKKIQAKPPTVINTTTDTPINITDINKPENEKPEEEEESLLVMQPEKSPSKQFLQDEQWFHTAVMKAVEITEYISSKISLLTCMHGVPELTEHKLEEIFRTFQSHLDSTVSKLRVMKQAMSTSYNRIKRRNNPPQNKPTRTAARKKSFYVDSSSDSEEWKVSDKTSDDDYTSDYEMRQKNRKKKFAPKKNEPIKVYTPQAMKANLTSLQNTVQKHLNIIQNKICPKEDVPTPPKPITVTPKIITATPKIITATPKIITATPKILTATPKILTATPKIITPKSTIPAASSNNSNQKTLDGKILLDVIDLLDDNSNDPLDIPTENTSEEVVCTPNLSELPTEILNDSDREEVPDIDSDISEILPEDLVETEHKSSDKEDKDSDKEDSDNEDKNSNNSDGDNSDGSNSDEENFQEKIIIPRKYKEQVEEEERQKKLQEEQKRLEEEKRKEEEEKLKEQKRLEEQKKIEEKMEVDETSSDKNVECDKKIDDEKSNLSENDEKSNQSGKNLDEKSIDSAKFDESNQSEKSNLNDNTSTSEKVDEKSNDDDKSNFSVQSTKSNTSENSTKSDKKSSKQPSNKPAEKISGPFSGKFPQNKPEADETLGSKEPSKVSENGSKNRPITPDPVSEDFEDMLTGVTISKTPKVNFGDEFSKFVTNTKSNESDEESLENDLSLDKELDMVSRICQETDDALSLPPQSSIVDLLDFKNNDKNGASNTEKNLESELNVLRKLAENCI